VEKSLITQWDNIGDSKCTEAYALFNKEKMKLIDVAIKLRLDEKTTIKFWREYCRLKNTDDLIRIYNEIGPDLNSFLELYKLMETQELSPKDVDYVTQKILDVQELEQHETTLKDKIRKLQSQEMKLSNDLDGMQQRWGLLEKYSEELEDEISLLKLQISRLKKNKELLDVTSDYQKV
jgi:SMC interacting uncharacterized protein involved in chromosome segregation